MFRTAERGGRSPARGPGRGRQRGWRGPVVRPAGAAEDTAGSRSRRRTCAGARPLTDTTRDAWRTHQGPEVSRGSPAARPSSPEPGPFGRGLHLVLPWDASRRPSVLGPGPPTRLPRPSTTGASAGPNGVGHDRRARVRDRHRRRRRATGPAPGQAGPPAGPRARPRTGRRPVSPGLAGKASPSPLLSCRCSPITPGLGRGNGDGIRASWSLQECGSRCRT